MWGEHESKSTRCAWDVWRYHCSNSPQGDGLHQFWVGSTIGKIVNCHWQQSMSQAGSISNATTLTLIQYPTNWIVVVVLYNCNLNRGTHLTLAMNHHLEVTNYFSLSDLTFPGCLKQAKWSWYNFWKHEIKNLDQNSFSKT